MEKLAEGLERLGEDDLLHVVQLVHDNKTEETYTKNDVESTSFGHCDKHFDTNMKYRRRVPRRPLHSSGPAH